jgi:hypothetical protein
MLLYKIDLIRDQGLMFKVKFIANFKDVEKLNNYHYLSFFVSYNYKD